MFTAVLIACHAAATARGQSPVLVVLSRDILVPAERDRIAEAEVMLTMVGRRVVYERGL